MRLIVLLLLFSSIYSVTDAQSLIDSLKAWYPFNGNELDMSGNGNDGVVNGATLTSDRYGVQNRAYFFDGISANIELSNDFDYVERTVNFWFNASSITQGSSNTMYDSDHANLVNGKTGFNVNNFTTGMHATLNYGNIGNTVDINLNQWYMVTITVSDSVRKYICDSLIATLPINPIHSWSGNFYASLGKTRVNDRFFHGKIDDVRIYNRALKLEEISMLCQPQTSVGESPLIPEKNNVKIYPNPTSHKATVVFDNSKNEEHTLTMYDTQGRQVRLFLKITTGSVIIYKDDLPSGLYFLTLCKDGKLLYSCKLVIE